jgi:hypothetical protein
MVRAASWWLLLGAAILGGIAALAFDRALTALQSSAVIPARMATANPTREPPIVVILPTANSTAIPTPATVDAAQISALQAALVQQGGLLLVSRAERHTALAAEALRGNDASTADRELVAARAALDSAFVLLSEDLKQVIDGQRREVGRMRSELQVHPEGMDQRLRAAQDLLLGLIVPPAP